MRGEQASMSMFSPSVTGSPPLARGTASDTSLPCGIPGITPACAGNRGRDSTDKPVSRDHPRLRGEQSAEAAQGDISKGSPPLARGTAFLSTVFGFVDRITPACAGNRYSTVLRCRITWDHPRLRGEQMNLQTKGENIQGSPPLARGTVVPSGRAAVNNRITPACAGNSCWRWPRRSNSRDHPRLRGEQSPNVIFITSNPGSPPLARGTASVPLPVCAIAWITPACAGNRENA